MATPPTKPHEQMTEEEVRMWKDWLLEEGTLPRPFANNSGASGQEEPIAGTVRSCAMKGTGIGRRILSKAPDGSLTDLADVESEYNYDPVLGRVIESPADGRRYIVGVRNGELQRFQELKDGGKSDRLPGPRPSTSRWDG